MPEPLIHDSGEVTTPVKELSKQARRVLGVLLEKAFTTPEVYPLTLKAATSGCNQKSNRSPLTNYSEDDVSDVLEKLREMGLVAAVHTESGRTERYRHYMRKRFTLSEAQLAILTELLLRGRQQVGELRARASRMVPIDTLEQLREELDGMVAMNLLQSTGSLDRRGVEVDHNLYTANEGMKLTQSTTFEPAAERPASPAPVSQQPVAQAARPIAATSSGPDSNARIAALESSLGQLQQENRGLHADLESIRSELIELSTRFDELKQSLGG